MKYLLYNKNKLLFSLSKTQKVFIFCCATTMEFAKKFFTEHNLLFPKAQNITNINSPIQYTIGGLCSSCLQYIHNDSSQAELVHTYINQEQCSMRTDYTHLKMRFTQNSLQEKITKLYLNHVLFRFGSNIR